MQLYIYLVINIFVSSFFAFISIRKMKIEGGKSILFLSIASLMFFLPNLLYTLSPSYSTNIISTIASSLGMTLAATALFTFSLEYTLRTYCISRPIIFLFVFIPVFIQILYWTPSISAETATSLEKLDALYRYSLVAVTVWLLGRTKRQSVSNGFDIHFWSMLIGPLLVFILQGFILLDINWKWIDELFSGAITLSLIGFSYNTFFYKSNTGQLRRGSVIEGMADGWIVLDEHDIIVDFNQATSKAIGMPREKLYGKSITSILGDSPDLFRKVDENQYIELDRALKVNDEYRYFNIRVSKLNNPENLLIGHLVIWRDITDRKREEDARQQARDEMFVLLNAISNAASQTISLKEFLSDAIYQIIYPFRSQAVFIYILDERIIPSPSKEKDDDFYLAAHLGLSSENVKRLNKLSFSTVLFQWMDENKKHVLFEDLQDSRIPESMQTLNLSCLLAIPLIVQDETDKKLIGILCFGRKEHPSYSHDDVVRLTILTDHIAALIDSDRRRKLAISLLERQRLMRDIHDSVSQKLYGLVTLTEAAQAGIEAGSNLDFEQVLSRIGENARQAVKELRLFLFQMQPINLEKEGLISVLHHRLAAVEGRADLKVRFLADDPIYISKRKEVALYYIAQEALNNVLRHARAKSVSVTLKQGYKYVTLEVIDDGCGFEQSTLRPGGLGLENIKERVKQENGKLRISSKPNTGTKIKVTFEQDMPPQVIDGE